MYRLQLLRNKTTYSNHSSAVQGINSKAESLNDGEMIVASYTDQSDDNNKKNILAIKHDGIVTLFDNEQSNTQITNAINALDQDSFKDGVTDTSGFVTIKLKQEDGIIKALSVLTNDIAKASVVGQPTDPSSSNTVFGKIQKLKEDNENKVASLNKTDTAVAKKFVKSVSETSGVINVERGSVTSNDKTITLSDSNDGGIDLSANIDNVTIKKDNSTGKLKVDSDTLTQYVGDNKSIQVGEKSGNSKTITLKLKQNDKILSQDTDGLSSTLKIVRTEGSGTVKETYKIVGIDGTTALGDIITINKDQSFKNGEIKKAQINGKQEDALVLTYSNASGEDVAVNIPLGSFLQEAQYKDGLEVTDGTVSLKIGKSGESAKYLKFTGTEGDKTLEISGVDNAISEAINGSNTSLSVNAQTKQDATKGYVKTTISQTNGKVANDKVEVTYGDYSSSNQKSGVATTEATKQYIDGISVSANGDSYITAQTDGSNNKRINITANVGELTISKSGSKSSLAGSSNKLVKADDLASKLNTFVETKLTEEAGKNNSTQRGNLTSSDAVETSKHVGVKVVQENGKITNVTVVENDIASAESVTNLEKKVTKNKVAKGNNAINIEEVTTSGNEKTKVSLKLDTTSKSSSSTSADNVLTITNDGLYLSSVWDCGTY